MQLELDLFVVDGQFVEQPKNRSATVFFRNMFSRYFGVNDIPASI